MQTYTLNTAKQINSKNNFLLKHIKVKKMRPSKYSDEPETSYPLYRKVINVSELVKSEQFQVSCEVSIINGAAKNN